MTFTDGSEGTHRFDEVQRDYGKESISDLPLYEIGFQQPLKGRMTAVYGTKRTLNDQKTQPRWALDIAASVGRRVKAPAKNPRQRRRAYQKGTSDRDGG